MSCSLSQVGKTSAFIGPFVSSAIITASGNNNNMPFAFLFGLYVFFLLSNRHWLTVRRFLFCLVVFLAAFSYG